jgi:type II secretory pathway component PulF
LERMKEDVESGSPLWRALERTDIFSEHTVSLLRIGEESGRLVQNLKVVGAQEEKERVFRSQLEAAMLYPLFVLSFTVVIGVGVAWFILPKLSTVFLSLKIELPIFTRILLVIGQVLAHTGIVVVPLFLLLLILAVYVGFFFPPTRFIGLNLFCVTPGVKRLIQELEVSRFTYLLGTLLEAGVPVTSALASLEDATIFPLYKKLYRFLRLRLDEGFSFQQSFAAYPGINRQIPAPVQQLIVAGEQSGTLTEILGKISASYEEKTAITTKNLTVILEPFLLVVVWLGVLGVALAVILPIYGLIGRFNTHGF